MVEDLRFEKFDKARHRRELFDCGNSALNDYLKTKLNQQMKRGVTAGYVLAGADGRVAGYVTLSSGRLLITAVPQEHGFPSAVPLPTTLIGRLAVDRAFQGRGLGGDLLVHAIRIAVETAEQVASAVIEVDAIDDSAVAFYRHYGFATLPDDHRHLYLPMPDAQTLIAAVLGH